MSRFPSPDDGKRREFPWEGKAASDTPELNAEVPQFLMAHLRTRHGSNLDPEQARIFADEVQYLKSLPLDEYDDYEGLGKACQDTLARMFGNDNLRPDRSLRRQLEEDMSFIVDAPQSIASKHWMLLLLVSGYHAGRYTPNSELREEAAYELEQLKISIYGQDAWDAGQAVNNVLRKYLQTVGAYGKPKQEQ